MLAVVMAGLLGAGPVFADKPEGKGHGKGHSGERHERRDEQRSERRDHDNDGRGDKHGRGARKHFEARHDAVVRDYYAEQFRHGSCPPGLAKKRNGCMPPGQAKKWQVGRKLPRDVVYYEVPQPLVTQIGPPPAGHRYIRVGSDVLMIMIGSGMVVDAIQNMRR